MIKTVFTQLIKPYDLDSEFIDDLWAEIEGMHGGEKRFYHNLDHLQDLYEQLTLVKPLIRRWDIILLKKKVLLWQKLE